MNEEIDYDEAARAVVCNDCDTPDELKCVLMDDSALIPDYSLEDYQPEQY